MTFLKKPTLPQQQQQLRKFIDERLHSEESKFKERLYQWLNDNQYFVDNELFDFYFCVAQNIAAIEELGGSGEKIVRAKQELDQSSQVYTTQVINISEQINQKLESHLGSVRESQEKLERTFREVLEQLKIEHQNLKTISTGMVNSASVLLKKQKQLLVETQAARKLILYSVIIAWLISLTILLGLSLILFTEF